MKDYIYAVYIGRFEPSHLGHAGCVNKGLEIADRVLILVGSSNSAPTIKNPFTYEQRYLMLRMMFPDTNRVKIEPLNDYLYNDNVWVSQVQGITSQYFNESDSVALIGDYSDSSSYYLKYVPQWEFVPANSKIGVRATEVRDAIFNGRVPTEYLHPEVAAYIQNNFYVDPDVWTDKPSLYQELVKEYNYIKKYKAQWDNLPFPVQFVTADATVVCSGHVLVVERGRNPGKGLFAVPGGFVKPSEHIQKAAIRELKEETGIRVEREMLEKCIERVQVFDHPDRSLRGRIVTHNYLIRLPDGRLPEVKAGDDASRAFWMPINNVAKNETKFFEDHAHMIQYFLYNQ